MSRMPHAYLERRGQDILSAMRMESWSGGKTDPPVVASAAGSGDRIRRAADRLDFYWTRRGFCSCHTRISGDCAGSCGCLDCAGENSHLNVTTDFSLCRFRFVIESAKKATAQMPESATDQADVVFIKTRSRLHPPISFRTSR